MQLETRFNLIITICLIFGLSIAGVLFYQLQIKQAKDTLIHDASLMLAYGLAVRNYTSEEVGPVLEHHMEEKLIPQTIPSYAAHATINKVRKQFPNYNYRELALNPTNQADRGNAWEVGIIKTFREHPETKQLSGENASMDSLSYFLAEPIKITDDTCLFCHGDPAVAPETLRNLYGTSNGFGWKMNEIIGARIVTVPADVAFRMVNNSLVLMLASLACIFLLTHVVFIYIFRRYVTRPLERITNTTEDASLNKVTNLGHDMKSFGQILVLETAIKRLRRSLDKAILLIEKLSKWDG